MSREDYEQQALEDAYGQGYDDAYIMACKEMIGYLEQVIKKYEGDK